ncbi:response regulator transcription factor [Gorillibacterium timonense]|uniref:response regulator transcription factor n=1 Tax=Gorillibacterium timonense TaxID=1689269 RepID=UPI00071CDCB1|nr:response regulator transcription factor [Gorillibacterium timonense]
MYNVLVVDDEERITEGMELLIDWKQFGFRIIGTAGDGLTALDFMQRNPVDLLVTDIRMPEMDGLELINALRSSGSRTRVMILSGYGDFQYAKKAIAYGVNDYLLKPVEVDELGRSLLKLKSELDEERKLRLEERQTRNLARDKVLSDYTAGVLSSSEFQGYGSRWGIALEEEGIRIGLVELTLFQKLASDSLYDAMLYRYGLRNMLEETLQQPGLGYVYEEAEGMIGIIFQPGMDQERAEALLTGVLQAARQWFRQDVLIGVGDPVPVDKAPLSRKQALYVLERNGSQAPICFYDSKNGPDELFWDVRWNSDRLIQRMEEGDLDKLEQETREFVRETETRRLPKPVVEGIVYSLFSKIGRLISRFEDNPAPFLAKLEREFEEQIRSGQPPFTEWFAEAMCTTGKHICLLAKQKEPDLIQAILHFINGHYSENLSLKQIAGLFYMNTAYLGQLFKQKTGQSFNDYLNKTRISAVKKELMQNRYAGMESINRAGFQNTEHFYRQFKRYEGITFSEYKDRHHHTT